MKTFLISLGLLFACSASFAEPMRPTVEPLLGSMTSLDGIHIQVQSRGCTGKNSFVVHKERTGAVTAVTFLRVDDDPCLALYLYGTELSYSYEELGLKYNESFFVRNPLALSKAR